MLSLLSSGKVEDLWVLAMAETHAPTLQDRNPVYQNWFEDEIPLLILQPFTTVDNNNDTPLILNTGSHVLLHTYTCAASSLPTWNTDQSCCVYQRIDPTSTHHYLCYHSLSERAYPLLSSMIVVFPL